MRRRWLLVAVIVLVAVVGLGMLLPNDPNNPDAAYDAGYAAGAGFVDFLFSPAGALIILAVALVAFMLYRRKGASS